MIRAAIYARVSTDIQAEKGYSIDTQLAACRQSAQEIGADIIKEFVDNGYSGEYIERPDMENLRKGIKNKDFDFVIVYDPDRLARNLAHQLIITEEIEKSGAQLKFVSVTFEHSPEGKLFYSIRGAISSYEKEKIKERTMRGKRGKLQAGKLVFNANPLGYDWDADKCMYVVNEDEAKVIRLIYDLCINEGLGTRCIALELNERAIPTQKNKKWSQPSIHKILTNEIYAGVHYGMKYYHKKTGLKDEVRLLRDENEWIPVSVPNIISKETWEKAKKQLEDNKIHSKRNTKETYLLQNILRCGKCGQYLSVVYSGKEGLHPRSYYWCRSRTNTFAGKSCGCRMIQSKILDNLVWDTLTNLCKNKKNLDAYIKSNSSVSTTKNSEAVASIKRLDEQEKKLIKQRETVMKWFGQLMISDTDAESQLDKIREQLQRINKARQTAKASLAMAKPRLSSAEIVSIYKSSVTENMTPEAMRDIIHRLIEKIDVLRTDNHFRIKTEVDMTIHFK